MFSQEGRAAFPERRLGLLENVRVARHQFGDVAGAIPVMALAMMMLVPGGISNAHETVRPRWTDLVGHGQLASEGIGRRPGGTRIDCRPVGLGESESAARQARGHQDTGR